MKVITTCINNSDISYGGAYRRYMELIRACLSRGWQVHHISPRGFSNIKHRNLMHQAILRMPIHPVFLSYMPQAFFRMLWIGARMKIDAIISFSLFDDFLAALYKRFHRNTMAIICDRGSVITGIKIENQNKPRFLLSLLVKLLEKLENFSYKNANLVIFNSEARRREFTNRVPLDTQEVKVVYNNANPSWVTERLEHEDINLDFQNSKVIGFVGNLFTDGRDLKTLIRAFKKVKAELGNIVLLLVGEGPTKEELVSFTQSLGLENDVIFTGWKDNPLPYIRSMNLLIATALHEGFSNTILEALYCGTVVIGSRVGGIPEALKYDELLFSPKDDEGLAAKIIELLTNEEKYRRAVELTKERRESFIFDWGDEMIKAIEEAKT